MIFKVICTIDAKYTRITNGCKQNFLVPNRLLCKSTYKEKHIYILFIHPKKGNIKPLQNKKRKEKKN